MFVKKKRGEHIQICCLRQTQYRTTKESVLVCIEFGLDWWAVQDMYIDVRSCVRVVRQYLEEFGVGVRCTRVWFSALSFSSTCLGHCHMLVPY